MEKMAGKPSVIKQANLLLVKEYIQNHPGSSKPQISKATHLSLVTVGKIIDELKDSNEIIADGYQASTGGRKAEQYILNVRISTVITILIRPNQYYVCLRDLNGGLLCDYRVAHQPGSWMDELFQVITDACGKSKSEVKALALAVPGTVSEGRVFNIPLIPEWENLNLQELIEAHFQISTVVENDINASTIGSHESYGSDFVNNMLFLYVGDGIGAGVVIRNKLYKSRHNFAGELGFMNIGRWTENDYKPLALEELVRKMMWDNRRHDLLDVIARILANSCCVLDPDLVVIDSHYLTENDSSEILRLLRWHLGMEYVPEILVTKVDTEVYSKGLFILCKANLQQEVRIYNQ